MSELPPGLCEWIHVPGMRRPLRTAGGFNGYAYCQCDDVRARQDFYWHIRRQNDACLTSEWPRRGGQVQCTRCGSTKLEYRNLWTLDLFGERPPGTEQPEGSDVYHDFQLCNRCACLPDCAQWVLRESLRMLEAGEAVRVEPEPGDGAQA